MKPRCKHKWVSAGPSIERGSGIDGAKQPAGQQKEITKCTRCGAVHTRVLGSNDDFRFTCYTVSSRTRYPKKK